MTRSPILGDSARSRSGTIGERAPTGRPHEDDTITRHALALAALTAIVVVYYLPQLLFGTVQYDGVDVHYASQRYLSDELRSGRLPFWTPYLFSGFPFLADLQVAAWYPLNWPFLGAGISPRSVSLELLLHTLIACSGAYLLAYRLVGRHIAALGAGVFYGLSGYFAAHAQHVGIAQAAAWLPWLVLLLFVATEGLRARLLAAGALLGAALALPGHFQVALYAFCGAGLWALLQTRSVERLRRVAIALVLVGVGGALLSAVMILPAAELASQSIRTELDPTTVNVGYFRPDALITLVWPDYFGLLSGAYHGPGDSTQHYFYAGILLVPMVLLGAHNRRVLGIAALLGLPFLWYALGPVGGIYRLISRLPGFASVELPMHGWFLPALGLALLGAAGLARLGKPGLAALAVAFTCLDVLVFNQLRLPLAFARGSFETLYGAPLQAFADAVASAQPPVERLYGPPLSAVGYRNHPLQSRVAATYGYNPLELRGYAAYADAAESNARLIDGFAANYRLDAGGVLEPIPSALPVAYFARRLTSVPDQAAARATLATLDPSRQTLVVGDVAFSSADPAPAAPLTFDPGASVSEVARGADSLTLQYASATRNLLRVAIPSFPGWHATLNGTELRTVTVDGAFVGVVVPPGAGELTLQYRPRFFLLGAAISVVAIAVTGVLLVIRR